MTSSEQANAHDADHRAEDDIEYIQRWADNWLARLPGYWEELPEIVTTADSATDAEAIANIEEWRHFESQR
ncbi:MAG: hypothetical protein H0V47_05360 [Chloroflexia bacterium]|jgi:hypothetical protein|nr:hypothetical protein [Chloroflexia bacterium]